MAENRKIVTYKQLLSLAHTAGLTNIITELIQLPNEQNGGVAFFKATITLEKEGVTKVFTGYADAAKNNVGPAMVNCLPRMAETRAKARALRDAVNVGDVAMEELADYDETSPARRSVYKPSIDNEGAILTAQQEAITKLCKQKGRALPGDMSGWTQGQAAEFLRDLQKAA